eukprot:TRINITY_DN1382_c1_g1_i1.p1 TRINITY_DN1382_c1_g1~~TRINITY_DN1382_c1_g1_i1.p1  ORF type:complete len:127 (-),score=28.83 TRINITY_DN1382_c1_g1_i1:163-543(-)
MASSVGASVADIPEPMYVVSELASPTLREWEMQRRSAAKAAQETPGEGRKGRSRLGKRGRDRMKNMAALKESYGLSTPAMGCNPNSRMALYYNRLQLGMPWKVNLTASVDCDSDPKAAFLPDVPDL